MIGGALDTAGGVLERIAAVDPALLVLALAFQLLNLALRSAAWRNVLRAAYPDARVRLLHVGSAYAAGVALNGVTVGRLGDALKVVLARMHVRGSSAPGIVATFGVIGLFDVLAAAVTVGVAWQMGAVPSLPLPGWSAVLAAAIAVALLAALLLAARTRLAPRLRAWAGRIADGGAILRTPSRYLREVAAIQALAWGARVGVVLSLLHAFHIPASPADALLVIVLGGVASALPSGPGGAGAQQLAVMLALAETTSATAALSFSVGMQLTVSATNAVLGVAGGAFLFRTMRPLALLRQGRALLASERGARA